MNSTFACKGDTFSFCGKTKPDEYEVAFVSASNFLSFLKGEDLPLKMQFSEKEALRQKSS